MRFCIQALIWLFVLTLPVNAAPVGAAIAAFASTAIGGIVVQAVVGIALSIGASLLQGLFTKKTDTKDPGTALQLRVGGDNPLFWPMGRAATAGVRIYTGTWSNPGGTPNEYAVDVLAVSTLPLAPGTRPTGIWFNDQKVTVRYDLPRTEQGWPIEEYFKNGQYWAWADFFDGNQTVANPYLLARFGSNPTYPWQSDMIGRGVAYVTITARYDKDGLWQGGFPSVLTELPSVPIYDPRQDSTNGGSGVQRWNDRSTWQPSNNAMVRAYNIARGMYYNNEWVYGGQNWPAFRLPASSWFAAMNACDLNVDGEPQFHGGGVVEADVEPASSLEELLRSSSGLIAEIGGIYKVRVGAPGAPVYGYTDDNIVVTREQGYEPFPGLENTFNIVRLSYTEPVEKWSNKESPERRDAALIISDDNRELPMSVALPWVLSNTTAQRIGRTALYNGRRFRKHQHFLGPIAWLLEPLDVVSWTSAHNGYIAKSFDIEQISGSSSFLQGVVLREVDPSDYNWNPATDRLPYETIPLAPQFPVAQPMTGWQVFPDVIYDNAGRARRPTIRVHYAAGLTDIDRVRVQVRLAGTLINTFDGDVPYQRDVSDPSIKLQGQFTPDTDYEARGILVPWSDRSAEWSEWLPVTTPDILLGELDVYLPGMVEEILEQVGDITEFADGGARELLERARDAINSDADDVGKSYTDRMLIRQEYKLEAGETRAYVSDSILLAVGPDSALATRLSEMDVRLSNGIATNTSLIQSEVTRVDGQITATSNRLDILTAQVGNIESSLTIRAEVVASPGGGITRYVVQAKSANATNFVSSSLFLEADSNGIGSAGFITNRFFLIDPSNTTARQYPFVFQNGILRVQNARIGWGQIDDVQITNAQIANLTVGTSNLDFNAVTAINGVSGQNTGYRNGNTGAYTIDFTLPPGVSATVFLEGTAIMEAGANTTTGAQAGVGVSVDNITTGVNLHTSRNLAYGAPGANRSEGYNATGADISPSRTSNNVYRLTISARLAATWTTTGYAYRFDNFKINIVFTKR